jgi:hypothetical protein
MLWSCKPKSSSSEDIIQPQYAKLFYFSTQFGNTTLNIIQDGDTIAVKKKNNHQFHLLSTTQVGYFDLLAKTNDIKGVVYPEEIIIPLLKARWQQGHLIHLNPGHGEIDQEQLWNQTADYVLYSPFDPLDFALPSATEKIPFLDYAEEHPLGRLEWIKVIGFLSSQTELAEKIFKDKVQQYTSEICKIEQPQKVVIGSWDGEYFYINGQKSTINQTLLDAGHKTLSPEKQGNVQWDKEMLWSKLPEIDHIIWITTTQQKPQLEKEMQQPESWQKKWGVTPHFVLTDTCSYFQMAIIQPEKLLFDLSHLNEHVVKTFVTN